MSETLQRKRLERARKRFGLTCLTVWVLDEDAPAITALADKARERLAAADASTIKPTPTPEGK